MLDKFENCQIFVPTFLDVARCCARLASSFTSHNTTNSVARCCVEMLRAFERALMRFRALCGDCPALYQLIEF